VDGIVGIYGLDDKELVNKTFLVTGACQHRGKASTGFAVGNGKGIYIYRGLGRIAEVIDYNLIRIFQDLEPVAAIGNIGYTKRKIAEKINAEPIEIHPRKGSDMKVVLTMDGYLIKEEPMTEYVKAIRAVSAGGSYFSQRVVPIMWGLNSNGSTPTLTPRELEVLELMATGAKADAIAEELFITPRTVTTHATNIYRKLGATNRAAAVRQAIKYGLISV